MTENNEKPTNTEKIDELIQAMGALSSAGRSRVLQHLRGTSIVIINDWLEVNLENPCAVIIYSNGDRESIDILDSVRKNATSIGHPVILRAIERWEQVVLTQYSLSRKKTSNAIWEAAQGDFKSIAKKHLSNISKALLQAAQDRERRTSKLSTFSALLQRIDQPTNTYLLLVWKILADDGIHYKSYGTDEDGKMQKKKRSYEEKLRVLKRRVAYRFSQYHFGEERLDPAPLDGYASLSSKVEVAYIEGIIELFGPIFDFLTSAECKRFIDKRPAWAVMKNSYIKWLTGRSINTAKSYRSETKKQEVEDVKIDFCYLEPTRPGNNHFYIDFTDPFLLPTIPCTLITCPCRYSKNQP